jgi:hypothetical protein
MSSFAYADAAGYRSCIESIAYFGKFNEDYATFCHRRPIYPFISGLILRLVGSIEFTQLVFVSIFALVLLYLVKNLLTVFDLFSVLITTLFLVYQWHIFASISLTTEVLGLILGPLSVAITIEGLRKRSTNLVALASTVLAFSLLVRPGNIFLVLIPLFLVLKRDFTNQNFKNIFFILAATFFPFLGIKFLGLALKINSLNSSLNFWGVLYGLSDQNKTWVDAQSLAGFRNADSEIAGWNYVRDRTLENLFANPLELPHNVLTNILRYIEWKMTFINSEFQSKILQFSNFEFYGVLVLITGLTVFGILLYPIRQALLFIFILFTTLITFGLFFNAEPYRTISSFHFLFVLIICSGFFNSLRYFLTKLKLFLVKDKFMISNTDSALDYRNKAIARKQNYVIVSTLVLATIFSSFSIVNQNVLKIDFKIDCVFDKNTLFKQDSLQILSLDEVEKPDRFLWGPILKSLPEGFLVHGIYQSDSKSVGVVNFYLPKESVPSVFNEESRYCFSLSEEQSKYADLWKVGLQIADIKVVNE